MRVFVALEAEGIHSAIVWMVALQHCYSADGSLAGPCRSLAAVERGIGQWFAVSDKPSRGRARVAPGS